MWWFKINLGKVALVTGASSDIGIGLVKYFLDQDIKVIGLYSNTEIQLEHPNLKKIQIDFCNQDEIIKLKNNFEVSEDKIQFLINCAGYIENQNFLHADRNEIWKTFQINLFAHIEIMQFIFETMIQQKEGRIISLSSIGVKFFGSPISVYYSASKAALEAVTKSFAKFGAEHNVLCNNIRVGVIETKIHKDKDMSSRIHLIPLKKAGMVSDVVSMVGFLCSTAANFITGQDFALSGGE